MKNRSALGILFLVVFVDLLGFGMVIPVMPLYAEGLGAPKEWIGLLMTGYSAMQFVFTPIWGRLSDRLGRRPLLLLSIGMTAAAFLGYALAPSFGWLLASRLFAGAATANIAIAQAYIADVTPPEGRAKGMGVLGAAFGLGFVLGPAIGGFLSNHSLAAPGYAAAALAAVNLLGAWFVLPEPASHVVAQRRPRFLALLDEMKKPGIRRLLVVYFVSILAFSGMEATFALLAHERFALDRRHVNYVFAYIGLIVVVVQGGLIGPLTRRFGEKRLLVAGFVLQGLGLAALPYGGGAPGLYLACIPLSVGSGLASPAMTALLSRSAREDDQGGTLGIGQSAAALGRIVGPESATWTYQRLWPGFPYLGGALLMAVAALVGATVGVRRAGAEEGAGGRGREARRAGEA
ncbi:MAG TPA: MFS transporter [Anaeromyxobacteraceae bacterium]|nr:MFS transporter [Anaeromyxobacteraceae bacterium]